MALPVIPIFFAVDDNYAPFLGVALQSLTENASKKYFYRIHVLTEGLNEENKKRICAYNSENVEVLTVDVTDGIRKMDGKIHVRDYYTKATYYRFFIADMFTQYDKGVYLDCDIIVNGDISLLYGCELGDNLVAAMNEEVMTEMDVYGTYVEKVLGVSRYEYFNAGVMVMNLRLIRKVDMQKRLAEIMDDYTFTVTQDQDYLNVLCHGNVLWLDQCWNKNAFPGCECEEAPADIVHFKINWKPWHYDGVGYEELFWEYAKRTPYYEQIRSIKENYSNAQKERDAQQFAYLAEKAKDETQAALSSEYILPVCHTIKICAEV